MQGNHGDGAYSVTVMFKRILQIHAETRNDMIERLMPPVEDTMLDWRGAWAGD